MDGWPAQLYFMQYLSYMGIPAPGIMTRRILALGWLPQYMRIGGIRIQFTAGGWGRRGLADGCCCESVA